MKKTFTLSGLLLVSACALAQTDTITGRVHQLDEVTVTETRRQHAVTSTAPLHLLDRQDMLTLGVTDMADALHRLPGITLRDYGGAGGMKTVSVRGFGAKHTGVSYDGVMLSDCQSGEIDLSRYSLDNVASLSLVVGDNDDIFIPARQASAPAVLSIQTLPMPTADSRPRLTTQLRLGSFGFANPFVRYEQNLSSRLALSLTADYTYADNDYPFELKNGITVQHERRTNSRMNAGHGELAMRYIINKVSQLSGKVYYYDNDRQLPGQVRYYTNLSGETLRDRNAFGQLQYQTRWHDRLSLKATAKMNWAASVYNDRLMPGGINDASYWQREYYAAAALLYTPNDRWALDYSTDYAYNNLNGSSWRTVVGRPYRHTVLQSATAKYRTRRLTVIGRLLYSLYLNDSKEGASARNMRRLSPSLSLSYRLLDGRDLYVRASYKNIFRSPTFNESYYYHYGSTDLLPESTDQWNLGVTYAADVAQRTRLSIALDGYLNHVKDMIVAVPQNMFVWTCVNVDKVKTVGLDVQLTAARQIGTRHTVSAQGHYAYQRVKNMNNPDSPNYGNQIAYQPEHTASGALSWENPWLNLSLHAVGMSSRWPNNEHYEGTMIDGYVELGLTAWRRFQWGRHRVEGRFDLKNLTDRQYAIVANYPMPGRSWQLTVNFQL